MGIFSAAVNNKDMVAVDIGSGSVKVLQLSRQSQTAGNPLSDWTIVGLGHSPINRSAVADKSIVDAEALGAAIEAALDKAKIKTKTAISAMPSAQATIKMITIPKGMSILEEEDYVQLEAGNHIPFSIDDVRYDYHVIGDSKDDDKSSMVLLAAAKIDQFQNVVDALNHAGLMVEVMDIDELAIERVMKSVTQAQPLRNVPEPIEVLIDLGHEFTTIHVFKDGQSVYTREQNFGMKQLIDETARRFGLAVGDVPQAIAHNKLPEDFRQEILPQFRSDVANQVNRLIQFFFAASSYNRVHRIWFSGGGASLDNLTNEVESLTGVTCLSINPLLSMKTGKHVDLGYIKDTGSAFLTAVGLAIWEE